MYDEVDDKTRWLDEQAPRLVLFARQWVPCHADAEDVFHTAFLRFWPSRGRVRDPVSFLYTCVRREALNWLRHRGRRRNHEQQAGSQQLFVADRDQLIEVETNEMIAKALSMLSNEQREVIVMRIWGELSFPQIGAVLSISPSTADTRYRAGLKHLHRELDGLLDA